MKRIAFLALMAAPGIASADKSLTKGTTWDCAKDAVVSIDHGGGTYTFKGACKTITLNGGGSHVSAEDVEVINVNAGGTTVAVDAVGTINVNGATNKISWKKAKSGDKPTITVNGANNKIDHAK